jgi:dTDP-4-dehydrorhamnose reductase
MKIAIIGANGQLGSDIFLSLNDEYEVFALTHEDIEIIEEKSIDSCLNKIKPEILINTAAYNDLKKCEEDPEKAFLVNSIGSKNLSVWCRNKNCQLVHISTDYVFDGKKNKPYTENDQAFPLSTYGITKLSGEHYISSILNKYKIIRTGGLYGVHPCRGKSSKNFVEMFLDLIKNKDVLEFGGAEICTPTFTVNVANQIKSLIEKKIYGIFHITNVGSCSWFEFGEQIIREINSSTKLIKRKKEKEKNYETILRPMYSVLENKKLNEHNLNLMPHWKEALKTYLNKK